jgi:hypothetical protein
VSGSPSRARSSIAATSSAASVRTTQIEHRSSRVPKMCPIRAGERSTAVTHGRYFRSRQGKQPDHSPRLASSKLVTLLARQDGAAPSARQVVAPNPRLARARFMVPYRPLFTDLPYHQSCARPIARVHRRPDITLRWWESHELDVNGMEEVRGSNPLTSTDGCPGQGVFFSCRPSPYGCAASTGEPNWEPEPSAGPLKMASIARAPL